MIVGPRQCDFDAFLKLVCEKIVCYLAVLYVLCHVWMERKLASSTLEVLFRNPLWVLI
jgi:hypothetical protein